MSNAVARIHRPSLLGSSVFDNVFDSFFVDFPRHLRQSTQGYPVVDIYRGENGSTVLEFALAGFTKDDLRVAVEPEKRSITVSVESTLDEDSQASRRIARRGFTKTYVNYDNNLDLSHAEAKFENGLLTVTVPPQPEAQAVSIKIQ